MKKFEYLAIPLVVGDYDWQESALDFRGKDGWELVSVCFTNKGQVAYFKRETSE